MKADLDVIYNYHAEHGEGPLWDHDLQKFIWVDMLQGKFIEGSWDRNTEEVFGIDQSLGVMGLEDNGNSIMAVRDGFGVFSRSQNKFSLIEPSPETDNEIVRFNDGIVGPNNNFYAGTMEWKGERGHGKLFRLAEDFSYDELDTDLAIPNGMGWNVEETIFYMVDTMDNCVYAFDYDRDTGLIHNKRPFIQMNEEQLPDGMTIDAEGCFWIAMWQGSEILVYSPEGKKIDEIKMPVPYPTSCTFGGPDMDHLFITSSKLPLDEKALAEYPLSGLCFIMQVPHRGRPEYRFDSRRMAEVL